MKDFLNNILSDNIDLFIKHKKQNKRNITNNEDYIISDIPISIPIPLSNETKFQQKLNDTSLTTSNNNKQKIDLKEGEKYITEIILDKEDEEIPISTYKDIINNIEENSKTIENQKKYYDSQYKNIITQIKDSLKNNIEENFNENKNKIETIALIKNIYEYLYDNFYKFSLVYDDFFEKLSDFKNIEIPFKDKPPQINEEMFLKQFRKDNLNLKINLIAFHLGKYNYSLFINTISKEFINMDQKEIFIETILEKYKGLNNDILYLKEFNKIVVAENNGMYIFEEKKENKDIKNEIPNAQNNNKKEILKLKPFKLKK